MNNLLKIHTTKYYAFLQKDELKSDLEEHVQYIFSVINL